MQLNQKSAKIIYNEFTGELLEVTFRLNDSTLNFVEVSEEHAGQFMNGILKLHEYTVITNESNELTIIKKEDKEFIRTFWELCDAENNKSPIEIKNKSTTGFNLIKRSKKDQDFYLYITKKNDPNVLFDTIRVVSNMFTNNECLINLNIKENYSVYVRNYAT